MKTYKSLHILVISVLALAAIMIGYYLLAPRCIQGDCQNGCGIKAQRNAFRYEGCFQNGRAHGRGTFEAITGDRYTGQWHHGLKSGTGIQYYSNNQRYEGQWLQGRRHGVGQLYAADGSVLQAGRWEQGQLVE